MALAIGDTAPDFEAETTEGKIRFHDWIGNNWVVLFSHPKDFTPVCTTELGTMARLKPEFDKRGVKIIGLSVDPVDNHEKWAADIKDVVGFAPNYPMIGDTDLKISKLYGMLPASHVRHFGRPHPGRQPDGAQCLRHRPRQEDQARAGLSDDHGPQLRRSPARHRFMQLNAKHRVATPANWKQGEDVILTGAVTDDEAKKLYPAAGRHRSPISAWYRSRSSPSTHY